MAERPTSTIDVQWEGGFKFTSRDAYGHTVTVDAPSNDGDAFDGMMPGVLLLTIIWWITEPIPIPATGLLGVSLAVIVGAVPIPEGATAGLAPVKIALAQFGNPTVFFLLGGMFIVARIGHGWGMMRPAPNIGRAGGAIGTWVILALLAGWAIGIVYTDRLASAPVTTTIRIDQR